MRPFLAAFLAGGACLLGMSSCAALPSAPALPPVIQNLLEKPAPTETPAPTPVPTPTPVPALLRVNLPEGDDDLQLLLDAYGVEQNVTIEYTSADQADLCVVTPTQADGSWQADSSSLHTALYTMLEADPEGNLLPLGYTGYGWLCNRTLLSSLLGDYGWNDLKLADMDELDDFCDALSDWIQQPDGQSFTLNNIHYTLPEEKPEGCEQLTAVFMPCDGSEDRDRVLGYAQNSAEDAQLLYRLLCLEAEYRFDLEEAPEEEQPSESVALTPEQAQENFAAGCTLFYRANTMEGGDLAARGMTLGLWAPPIQREPPEEEPAEGEEAPPTPGLPLAGVYRLLGIPAHAADNRQASAFLYWLYTGYQGQHLITDTFSLAQPGLRIPSAEPSADLARHIEGERFLEDTALLRGNDLETARSLIDKTDFNAKQSDEDIFTAVLAALFNY